MPPAYTPVIPPLPSPEGRHEHIVEPPVVPAFSPQNLPHTPSWARGQPLPGGGGGGFGGHPGYPQYLTPGVPVMQVPGSYFMPPVALPPAAGQGTPIAPVGSNGFSADWTGFPTVSAAGPVGQGTPWGPPGAFPGTGPPPVAAPPTGYSTFQQPLPGFGGWPPTGAAIYTPYAPPGAIPAAGGWGGYTPHSQSGALPAGFGPQPGIPPPAPPGMHSRSQSQSGYSTRPNLGTEPADRFDKFAEEPSYGPVLEPFLTKVVKAKLQVNPLLQPPPDDLATPFLKWNMLFPTGQCQRSTDPGHRSWSDGRFAPATWPRVTSIRLVSKSFPWEIDVPANEEALGVTCGDVVEAIHLFMYGRVSGAQLEGASPTHKRVVSQSFYHNRSTAFGVPGGRLQQTLLRCDWLGQNTVFGGIVHDDHLAREITGCSLPCTLVLMCVQRYPMTQVEIDEHEAREREADEIASRARRSRNRSRATSRATSRAPSRAPSRGPSVRVEDVDESDSL